MSVRRKVLAITGAGISAESGIPTFRGAGGYWRNLDPMKLATPEAFATDPRLVWDWYRERRQQVQAAEPNEAHVALVQLAAQSTDFLLVTQNVDNLHQRARWDGRGLANEQIVQIHGDLFATRCSGCGRSRPASPSDDYGVPTCESCAASMRPDVIWFGEMLDHRRVDYVESFIEGECDTVVVVGTTAAFGYIVDWACRAAAGGGHLIEINPEPTPLSELAHEVIRVPSASALPQLLERFA